MPAPIGLEQHLARTAPVERAQKLAEQQTDATPPGEFAERLAELFKAANESQVSATAKVEAFAEGKSHDLQGTMIEMQRANIQLRLLGTVRNKMIEAYREVMRMGA